MTHPTKNDPYPLKKYHVKPIHLANGWYILTQYRSLDLEKSDGRSTPRRGWIENYNGLFTINGDAPGYIQKLYYKWLCENTLLIPMFK